MSVLELSGGAFGDAELMQNNNWFLYRLLIKLDNLPISLYYVFVIARRPSVTAAGQLPSSFSIFLISMYDVDLDRENLLDPDCYCKQNHHCLGNSPYHSLCNSGDVRSCAISSRRDWIHTVEEHRTSPF